MTNRYTIFYNQITARELSQLTAPKNNISKEYIIKPLPSLTAIKIHKYTYSICTNIPTYINFITRVYIQYVWVGTLYVSVCVLNIHTHNKLISGIISCFLLLNDS